MAVQIDKQYPAFQRTQEIVTKGTRARVSQVHPLCNFNRTSICVPLIQHTELIQSALFPGDRGNTVVKVLCYESLVRSQLVSVDFSLT